MRDRISWALPVRPLILGNVDLDGFGESHVRLPLDGHCETCSPESNDERPRPATGCCAKGT